MPLYLDFNATTPVHDEVLEVMIEVYQKNFGNPASRTHIHGHQAKQLVDNSRKNIAAVLGVNASEVIFTSGATESNNISILGLEEFGISQGKKHIISSAIEHSSVLGPLEQLSRKGFRVDLIPVGPTGRITVEDVISRVTEETLLVSVMHANNETGVIQPVKEIGEELVDRNVYFHVDAAQTLGKLVEELREVKYDLLSITAHKIYGPQGIGALVLKSKKYKRPPITPLMFGGKQEKGLRPGTLPAPLIAGFGKAAELALQHYGDWRAKELEIKNNLLSQLEGISYLINGDICNSLPNCINVSIPGVDSEALMMGINEHLSVSNGSACTSSEYKPSYVLQHMGALAENAVRLSWGPNTDFVDLTSLIKFVQSI
ncbi:aminotransferase class V-fold PLP-dependent enzyme [Paenibacillus sp. LHD-117]|uniref:cysteine desulfurase family protein n=1 Tax=Paenibacillus sp. LHD-117 TaxID=3071412 RepID=UPI0027DEEBE3|nr:aminotransferase class V-fold PLP-dependent enzyme [Paenibacillus sp. LHD-117]MDQ6423046.1 aminotransferase class V-fold PLP-dependent enzyme [Paenibacillus sp. LHD-117]